ncbi:glycoside hydrolase family 5 protein [Moniliophthora roreri MCA 2997]|uniref:mannan endo-1,4-beta-mannosidase n=1 Tax=Moniliophthora roreri (strain MCA 2997) TaxID=1381753 RepID=V2X6U7_MONRO|nr:glycoside hydrolase family 5 protein [Moniliophthora roreri MCA 2997]
MLVPIGFVFAALALSIASAVAQDFVKTSGRRFTLNGAKFTVIGSNSYWVGLSGLSTTDMNKAFAGIAKTGATVANGIRLIVPLTNNWSDYGGMDVYINQIIGNDQPHDLFYTNAKVISAYKNYINAFVGRYKNEPTIMAWELANEPRCKGTTGKTSGTCTPATITKWATDISAYIKSIDSNHLVALGDEGFFNRHGSSSFLYQGSEGIDFDANLKISTLDFGTTHCYPENWGQKTDPTAWGSQWIKDHAASQKSANKPVILEEFGVKNSQNSTYTTWLSTVISSGLTGDLIWQAGSVLSNGQRTPDDGYAIYPDNPVYLTLTSHASALKARA